jgi:hypothetical protein
MTNATALRAVLEHVRGHQDAWDQEHWTDCFAGHAVRVLAGATFVDSNCCANHDHLTVDGEKLYGFQIGVRAAELLGLTADQARRLFGPDNSLDDLTRLVDEFTADQAAAPQVALAA